MKAFLFSGCAQSNWARDIFPELSPASLPVAGKSWCFHAVDLCNLLHVSDVLVVDSVFNSDLGNRLGNGSYWSLNLQYKSDTDLLSPDTILSKLNAFAAGDDLLIIWGMLLPEIEKAEDLSSSLRLVEHPEKGCPNGIYLLKDGRLYECVCPLLRLDSLKSFFDSNFLMLHSPGIYSPPGYSSEKEFSIGMNVIIMPDSEISMPVIIKDNALVGNKVKLHNGVIIGRSVAIDTGAELDHSIIMNHSYVGRNILIRNKIVNGERVIDPETNDYVDLDGDILVGNVSRNSPRLIYRFFERLIALLFILIEWPLFLLAWPFRKWEKLPPFFGFVLNVYPKFFKVLFGRTNFVRLGFKDTNYVLQFSDSWYPIYQTKEERDIVDAYYFHHRTSFLLISVVVLAHLRRMLFRKIPWKLKNGNRGLI